MDAIASLLIAPVLPFKTMVFDAPSVTLTVPAVPLVSPAVKAVPFRFVAVRVPIPLMLFVPLVASLI